MGGRKLALAVLFCLVLAMLPSHTVTVAVMSVDLGSEWMKTAIVKPGVPMEIVLNKESRRKTPTAVCLKENERLLGDNALGWSVKNPKTVYRHLQSLLGKKHDNLQVELYKKRFPEHQLLEDPVRGTVYFKNSDHSFHQHCFESYAESEAECPTCTPENRKVMDMLRAQDQKRDLHDHFNRQLRSSNDGFSVVADYFGRGVFNKLTLVTDPPGSKTVGNLEVNLQRDLLIHTKRNC